MRKVLIRRFSRCCGGPMSCCQASTPSTSRPPAKKQVCFGYLCTHPLKNQAQHSPLQYCFIPCRPLIFNTDPAQHHCSKNFFVVCTGKEPHAASIGLSSVGHFFVRFSRFAGTPHDTTSWLHVDQAPLRRGFFCVQGIVNLVDVSGDTSGESPAHLQHELLGMLV